MIWKGCVKEIAKCDIFLSSFRVCSFSPCFSDMMAPGARTLLTLTERVVVVVISMDCMLDHVT